MRLSLLCSLFTHELLGSVAYLRWLEQEEEEALMCFCSMRYQFVKLNICKESACDFVCLQIHCLGGGIVLADFVLQYLRWSQVPMRIHEC